MPHLRITIRQEFVNRLLGNTPAQRRVYDSRVYTLEKQTLPAIIVFSDHEDIATDTISFPRSQSRTLRVTVQCYVKNNDTVSTEVDNLVLAVEQLLMTDSTLGGLAKDFRIESCDISMNHDGERPVAVASLVFVVLYKVKENAPSVMI
jgi:hypothetical protein